MLCGGGKALDWNVSMHGIRDRQVTYIVFAKDVDNHKLDLICLEMLERRLAVDFEGEGGSAKKF